MHLDEDSRYLVLYIYIRPINDKGPSLTSKSIKPQTNYIEEFIFNSYFKPGVVYKPIELPIYSVELRGRKICEHNKTFKLIQYKIWPDNRDLTPFRQLRPSEKQFQLDWLITICSKGTVGIYSFLGPQRGLYLEPYHLLEQMNQMVSAVTISMCTIEKKPTF